MTRVHSPATPYGLGLGLGLERYGPRRQLVRHSGGDGGYTSLSLTDRRTGVTIAVLSNQSSSTPTAPPPPPAPSAGDIWLALLKAHKAPAAITR